MPRVKKLDLGMTALDELFMNDKERAENKLPKIFDIPLSEIDDFPGHPYRVLDDEDMQNLMESIKDRGVITPAMVRKKDDGRYEMISGHRRKHASERLGLETLRCEVVEVSRDEAIILMVDSNAQRSVILPCDKGRAYKMKKMKLEALKRQGQRTDLTSTPPGEKLEGKDALSVTQISNESSESQTQIQRYIRLTYMSKAEENDFCFIEDGVYSTDNADEIILCKWNRHYPADKFFDTDLKALGFKKVNTEDIAGTSHEKITIETYRR